MQDTVKSFLVVFTFIDKQRNFSVGKISITTDGEEDFQWIISSDYLLRLIIRVILKYIVVVLKNW